MNIFVSVTQEDIKDGSRGYGSCCPVALALRRTLEAYRGFESASVAVGINGIYINHRRHQPPTIVEIFILKFDNGHPVEPFDFQLEVWG